jgi:molybdate transport system permease protein
VLSVAIYDYVETSRWREASILAAGMVVFGFSVILGMTFLEKRLGRRGA